MPATAGATDTLNAAAALGGDVVSGGRSIRIGEAKIGTFVIGQQVATANSDTLTPTAGAGDIL